ncbi:hypothetical protein AB6A40_001046 [Gnathostoma spinigerum]|uniref:Uncharacterized protein n=1 Tax=Gnathostoma spinigerum TaxID=75299 RepID=A0ABD6E5E8_9BILA
MNNEIEPSSSDDIIASLLSDVQKSNAPFDVKALISGRNRSREKSRNGSISDDSEYSERRKDKKKKGKKKDKGSRKNHRSSKRSRSRSISRKKKHRERSPSERSVSDKDGKPSDVDTLPSAYSKFTEDVEAVMEAISDDDDDLPVGADFRSMNALSAGVSDENNVAFVPEPVMNTGSNKRREFVGNEEFFPIAKAKKRRRSKSLTPEKKRPLSEILAKVRAEKEALLVPRNIKLKQDLKRGSPERISKPSSSTPKDETKTESRTAEFTLHDDSEEYGPQPAAIPSGPLPISEDEDEVQENRSSRNNEPSPKGSEQEFPHDSDRSLEGEKPYQKDSLMEEGVPVSDDSTIVSNKREDAGDTSDTSIQKASLTKSQKSYNASFSDDVKDVEDKGKKKRKDKKDKKGRKRKKKNNEKKRDFEDVSSSSDSEKEWSQIERKRRVQRGAISSSIAEASHLFSEKSKSYKREPSVEDYEYTDKRRGERDVRRVGEMSKNRGRRFRQNSRRSRKYQWNQGDSGNIRRDPLYSSSNRISVDRRRRDSRNWASNARRKNDSASPSRSRSHSGSVRSHSRHRSSSSSYDSDKTHRSHDSRRSHDSPRKRSRRRSSSERSGEHKIDKKKLLEIAQKNAAQMAQTGALPSAVNDGSLKKITTAQSVDQLVDFCQRLQRSQDKQERREKGEKVSSDEEEKELKAPKKKTEEETDFVHHPFALKPAAPITINITNSAFKKGTVPIQSKISQIRSDIDSQLSISFPVSSGQQHRTTDSEWEPVKKESLSDTGRLDESGAAFFLPPPPKPPELSPVSSLPLSPLYDLPPPPPPPVLCGLEFTPTANLSQTNLSLPPALPFTASTENESLPLNVGEIMAQRVEANKRLKTNPNDFEAMRLLKEADEKMNAWARSHNTPGKFTGSTGVHVLSADELGPADPRYSAWARKDLFKCTNRVESAVGLKLMQKMGWSPGEGLGKCSDGPLEPLAMDIKSDRKGLFASDEHIKKPTFGSQEILGKHPVSVLMELCTKNHWQAPQFSCTESGPSNNRRFLWKAVVNGVTYQPAIASSNKKTGKAQICQIVLESLGVVPKESSSSTVLSSLS